ncbi:hypothetical protein H2200_010839 [Cladophialophora chaetospira]|uniref:KANL3/Tex30 alpha/beta hydrolase-like domain-containing protein n=1 Tax=Cladophialophora chaetospira TaxID=386627 RepID=A0AA38X0V1_9EURO|nr:hypothetical protein H2200_010839 [Cladophialophora chaetospira]
MAPRKRKIEAAAADTGADDNERGAPLRRSTRRKTTSKPRASNQENSAAAGPKPDNDTEHRRTTKPSKKKKQQVTSDSAPTAAKKKKEQIISDSAPTATKVRPRASPLTPFSISSAKRDGKETSCLRSHSEPEWPALIFTHGAGGDLSAAAMVNFSTGFAASKLEFGMVMFAGSMNLKGRANLFDVVKKHELGNGSLKGGGILVYGGRSMGARAAVVASQTDQDVQALVLVSYPLVGPSGDMRDKILLDIRPDVDVLFISGANDNMCDWDKLNEVRSKMKAKTWCVKVHGADHGMNVRGAKNLKDGTWKVGNMTGLVAAKWLLNRDKGKRDMDLRWDGTEVIASPWELQESSN